MDFLPFCLQIRQNEVVFFKIEIIARDLGARKNSFSIEALIIRNQ
jgi:hypothetical protein